MNDNEVFTIEPFEEKRKEDIDGINESDSEFYKRKLDTLRSIVNKRTIIILDNVDHFDTNLVDFLSLECPVIVTTRWTIQDLYPDATIEIESRCDIAFCREVFWAHYFKNTYYRQTLSSWKLQEIEADNTVDQIIEYFEGHILALELVARQMNASHQTSKEIWDIIQQQKENELKEGFYIINKSNEKKNMVSHILQIFKLSGLSDEQVRILFWLSLFPNSGVKLDVFRNIVKLKNFIGLNDLKERSWIREDIDNTLSVHPLIGEGVQLSYEPEQTEESARIYCEIAVVYIRIRDYDNAITCFKKALSIRQSMHGTMHESIAEAYQGIANVYLEKREYDEAMDYYKKALEIEENVLDSNHPLTLATRNGIAIIYHTKDEFKKSFDYFERTVLESEKVFGKQHHNTIAAYNNLAAAYHVKAEYNKALEYYNKALSIRCSADDPDSAKSYTGIASVYRDMGDYGNAMKYIEKALAIKEAVYGIDNPETATTYIDIASVLRDKGDYDKALEYANKALSIMEKAFGAKDSSLKRIYHVLATIYQFKNDFNNALKYYEKALNTSGCPMQSWIPSSRSNLTSSRNSI